MSHHSTKVVCTMKLNFLLQQSVNISFTHKHAASLEGTLCTTMTKYYIPILHISWKWITVKNRSIRPSFGIGRLVQMPRQHWNVAWSERRFRRFGKLSFPIASMYGIFAYIYHKKSTKCRYIRYMAREPFRHVTF